MRTNLIIYFLFITLILAGCTMGSGPVGAAYHNLTAHFNAYFIADQRMMEIEQTIYDNYQWNYNKVLPIYVPIDSNDAKSLQAEIQECIEKSSMSIQRHPDSHWEDDAYILVGKARYYSLEFSDAIETFKYVNKHSHNDNARHAALIELIKSFVDFNEINNAIAVSDYMKKEELNQKNQKELNMVRAYMFQKRNDYDQMVQNLVKAEALMKKYSDRARIDFIIGQVYQQLGFEAEAYNYYESCLKSSPTYELSFYTKLNMAQVTQLTGSGDIKKIRKYFRNLLKDPKNLEYKDKIYYEMGNFEVKRGNLEQAIAYYKQSAKSSIKNKRQKAYSYLKLGRIYYDSLRNFELAQNYYDSTVQTMPKDEENYDKIKQRQEILNDFVKQLNIIRTNDSLVVLSQLPKDSLTRLATTAIKDQEAKELEKRKKQERKQAAANLQNNLFNQQGGNLINASIGADATWYFYNPTVVSKGNSEFKTLWGKRPLEDNWRRSMKSGGIAANSTESVEKSPEQIEAEQAEADAQFQEKVDALLAAVPTTQEAIDGLLAEVQEALYQLGKIYNFNLEENDNAAETFETLIARFPDSEYKAEALYQLYLLYKQNYPELSEAKGEELKASYPESIYAKLVDNPNYREESHAATEQLKKIYTRAYKLYKTYKYKESKFLLDSALAAIPDNSFSDNLQLLNILDIGELDGQIKYQFELNNFIKNYPESDVLEYAQSLLKASEEYQINLYNSAKAKFVAYFDQKHFLVIAYPNRGDLTDKIPEEVDQYVTAQESGLTVGNLVLDEQNALILINEFPSKNSASDFLALINSKLNLKDLHKGEKIYSFVITEDNFDILYQTKDINAYLNFFETHYPQ